MEHIEITQDLALAPDAAWRVWSTDQGLAEWFWPQIPDTDYRFNPGQEKHWRIASEGAQIGASGEFTKVEKPTRLELTWQWETPTFHGDAEPVTVTLTPQGTGTRCVLTHACPAADRANIEQGWRDCLGRLGALR